MFDTNYKLYNHRYAVHNLQDCRCEFCGGTYKNKKLLQVHKRVSHPGLYEAARNAKHLQEIQEYAASMHNPDNLSKEEAPQLQPIANSAVPVDADTDTGMQQTSPNPNAESLHSNLQTHSLFSQY